MTTPRRDRALIFLAFVAIYLIWGSTYLGIKVAIEAMPPFFMAGTRFMIAGAILLACMMVVDPALGGGVRALRAALAPGRLMRAAVVGLLMLGVGNGCVVWAIHHGAPTGLVAVMIATTPLWLVLLDSIENRLAGREARVAPAVMLGLALGLVGIVVLRGVGATATAGLDGAVMPMLLVASLAWACGSIVSKRGGGGGSPLIATGLQMLIGGAAITAASVVVEGWPEIDLRSITARSWIGYAYLIVFGSLVGYTAFIWLLRRVSAAAVGTYAYVNPVVAVILGALLADEAITLRTMIASAIVLAAVALITTARSARSPRAPRARRVRSRSSPPDPCRSTRTPRRPTPQ